MEYHIERGLRLLTEPEHKGLYSWAINEVDSAGQVLGQDQIPWAWTLYFTATSLVLGDAIEVKSTAERDGKPATREVDQRQTIRIKLKQGDPREGRYSRPTKFSMFGTDREIKEFQVDIHPIRDAAEAENCSSWGCISYDAEADFRRETEADCVIFYLMVRPETFARYASKIALGAADEIVLRVGRVSGFYSEWSPSISTRDVKVLAAGAEQNIQLPVGVQFEPPRLGDVGEVELYINRKLEFGTRPPIDDIDEPDDGGTVRVVPPEARAQATDPQTLKVLTQIRMALWVIAGLTVVVALKLAS